jgi:subtilisin family serine protease
VIEVALATTPQVIAAFEQRQNLTQLEQLTSQLSGTNLLRARIQDGRAVAAVVLALQAEPAVMSAQPNYVFALQQKKNEARETPDDGLQYALAKLRLPEAHQIAKGGSVLVAIIDSGIDTSHPELTGAIGDSFDAIDGSRKPDSHGTAVAGLIVAHGKLTGIAPAARILAVRAFETVRASTAGSSYNVLKGLDWAAVHGARIFNMSFAGPSDPAIHRALESADRNGIVLIAAAGNAGPKSPPLYPGADPLVIAVTATDAQDKYFASSNRGRYIGVAAPGVDILVAAPGGRYQISSGTSFSAAEVSGIAALVLERKPNLSPDSVRRTLLATGRALPPEGARLVDAYQAVSTDQLVLPVAAR